MKKSNAKPPYEYHQILLSPELTVLVVVDYQLAFGPCFDDDAVDIAENGVAKLVDAAKIFDIPVITSLGKNQSY